MKIMTMQLNHGIRHVKQSRFRYVFSSNIACRLVAMVAMALLISCGDSDDLSSHSSSNLSSSSNSSSSNSASSDALSSSSSSANNIPTPADSFVRISEAAATNTEFVDEDGDTPDWFELHNSANTAVDLSGWSITDSLAKPNLWTFPSLILSPGEYLLVWASDKDRTDIPQYRTLVNQGDLFTYLIPDASTPIDWQATAFNDNQWSSGPSGFGFGDNDDATEVTTGAVTLYLRTHFSVAETAAIEQLILDIDYDDGFIAYINGVEVARANMDSAKPSFDATSSAEREAEVYQGGAFTQFVVADVTTLLQNGDNSLAIEVHNSSTTSTDLTLIPILSARYKGDAIADGTPVDQRLGLNNSLLHSNFKISSNGETLYLFNSAGQQVDSLTVGGNAGISVGRSEQNAAVVYYSTPTPGSGNTTTEYLGVTTSTVEFSHTGGVLSPASVSLFGATEGEIIRFTLDATVPNKDSEIFSKPIDLSGNTVVRASVFQDHYIPSPPQSFTYLNQDKHDIAVVTLATNPLNLFDMDYGIYAYGSNYERQQPYFGANFWQDWERPVHFAFYEADGTLGTELNAGVKIFGGWSRANPQRSLAIFARAQYGEGKIDYPLFPQLDYARFESIVLRNSGNDFLSTSLRDAALTSLMDGSGLETQAFRPVATYLNGEYWGMYNLREKVNEHFLASKYAIDADDIDLLEGNANVIEGSNEAYLALLDFLTSHSLSDDANFQVVAEQVDIDNFIIYQVAQIYFNNTDWPGNNIKYWKSPDTKWRWILYDTDFSFGLWEPLDYLNDTLSHALATAGPEEPNPPWSTLLLRKLLENTEFKRRFINRFADELNTRFQADQVSAHIDSLAMMIATEMPRHFARWEPEVNTSPRAIPKNWAGEVTKMKDFAELRAAAVQGHILNQFNLASYHRLTIELDDPNRGYVQLNNLTLTQPTWQGEYFAEIPVTLTAIAAPGFMFSHWQDNDTSPQQRTVNLTENRQFQPIFIPQLAIPVEQ